MNEAHSVNILLLRTHIVFLVFHDPEANVVFRDAEARGDEVVDLGDAVSTAEAGGVREESLGRLRLTRRVIRRKRVACDVGVYNTFVHLNTWFMHVVWLNAAITELM